MNGKVVFTSGARGRCSHGQRRGRPLRLGGRGCAGGTPVHRDAGRGAIAAFRHTRHPTLPRDRLPRARGQHAAIARAAPQRPRPPRCCARSSNIPAPPRVRESLASFTGQVPKIANAAYYSRVGPTSARHELDDHAHQPGAHPRARRTIPRRPSSRRTWTRHPGLGQAMPGKSPMSRGSSSRPTRGDRAFALAPVLINVLYSVTGSDNLYLTTPLVGLENYATLLECGTISIRPRARATSSGARSSTRWSSCPRRSWR